MSGVDRPRQRRLRGPGAALLVVLIALLPHVPLLPQAPAAAQATTTEAPAPDTTVDPNAPAAAPTLPPPPEDPVVTGTAEELVSRGVPGPAPAPPTVGAAGAVLFDPADQVVLFGVDERTPRRMASTTKVMTVLLALEAVERGLVADELTVSPFAAQIDNVPGGASLGLTAGQTVGFRDLLAALLLRSGNGGAVAVAEHVAGNETAYAAQMTARAEQLGLEDTAFINASGLTDDPAHHATPLDLARLGAEAMRHPDFAAWAGAATLDVPGFGALENRNEMLTAYDGTTGIKTGFTTLAGECLVASAERDGRTLYAVVLGSDNRVADTTALFDHGFEDFARPTPLVAGDTPQTYRWAAGEVSLSVAEDLARTVGAGAEVRTITRLAPDAALPVATGTPLGEAVLVVDGEEVDRTPLLADADVAAGPDSAGDAIADALRALTRLDARTTAVTAS